MTNQYINDLLNWGWLQVELAKELGTTQPTIHRWWKGAEPGYKTGKKVEELWKREQKRQNRKNTRNT